MALHARWSSGDDDWVRGSAELRGMFQSPLVWLRVPLTIICPSLNTFRLYFPKRAMQSSSQSLPIEMREPVCRLSRMCPLCASFERNVERGTVASWVACMVEPDADLTVGPVVVAWMAVQVLLSALLM